MLECTKNANYKRWTSDDIEFVRSNFDMDDEEIGEAIGRSAKAVCMARIRFNIKKSIGEKVSAKRKKKKVDPLSAAAAAARACGMQYGKFMGLIYEKGLTWKEVQDNG